MFGIALLTTSLMLQDKPATLLADIIACVQTNACKNAKPSKMSWGDVGGIPVQVLTDGQSSFALALSTDGLLRVWVTAAGESRPGRVMTLGSHGQVTSAELGRQPGEGFPMRMTPEQTAAQRELRKSYRSSEHPSRSNLGPWGDKYKTFWQEQADAAVAAIRRQISK